MIGGFRVDLPSADLQGSDPEWVGHSGANGRPSLAPSYIVTLATGAIGFPPACGMRRSEARYVKSDDVKGCCYFLG